MSANATIHERMVAILSDLPAIGKNQKNAQQGFMFRGHDDVLNALNPLLAKHGVFVVPTVLERVTDQRTTSRGGTMYEVNLHVSFTFYGAGGDSVTASTWGEGTDSGDKATNKAMTMAFKNVLIQSFAISSEEFKDADGDTPENTTGRAPKTAEPESPFKAPPPKESDRDALVALITRLTAANLLDDVQKEHLAGLDLDKLGAAQLKTYLVKLGNLENNLAAA